MYNLSELRANVLREMKDREASNHEHGCRVEVNIRIGCNGTDNGVAQKFDQPCCGDGLIDTHIDRWYIFRRGKLGKLGNECHKIDTHLTSENGQATKESRVLRLVIKHRRRGGIRYLRHGKDLRHKWDHLRNIWIGGSDEAWHTLANNLVQD